MVAFATQRNSGQQKINGVDANIIQTGQKLTVDNVARFLKYEREFRVLICKVHGYAVRNLENHLRTHHVGSQKEKKAVVDAYKDYQLSNVASVPLPEPLKKPFASLGKPRKAYICEEPECGYISINRDVVRIHCNKEHNWKSTEAERKHWHQVWVQTFFSAAGLQRYFTVDYNESEDEDGGDEDRPGTADQHHISNVLENWDRAIGEASARARSWVSESRKDRSYTVVQAKRLAGAFGKE